MCGIAGIYSLDNNNFNYNYNKIKNCIYKIKHRGPDAQKIWYSKKNKNLILGHSRLSIIDLSEKGGQPMRSHNNNFVISYNGEIYNHKDIKEKLQKEFKLSFFSSSDTEVLLKSIEFYGLDKTLKLIDGMYAFALWNDKNKTLYLARDRFGEKPLYFHLNEDKTEIEFSSELTEVGKNLKLNKEAISNYFKFGYLPFNQCIYKNWDKVKPGEYIKISINKKKRILQSQKKIYWTPKINNYDKYKKNYLSLDQDIRKFENVFLKSVSRCLISDVKTGTFLSSGIDSSLVTTFAKEIKTDVKSFTLSVKNDQVYNEAINGKKISDYLNVENEVFEIDQDEILNNLKNCILSFDEPFADSSQVLSYILAKKIKKKTKVILTGDGADEMFCGYNRHIIAFQLAKFQKITKFNSSLMSYLIKFGCEIPSKKILSNFFSYPVVKLKKINEFKNFSDLNHLYEMLIVNNNAMNYVNKLNFKNNNISNYKKLFNKILEHDLKNYLPNDILVKVDRSTMHSSIEARCPFLSKSIFDFSQRLPYDRKISNLKGKYLLRKVLSRRLPENLISKKKMGFSFSLERQIFIKKNKKWLEKIFSKKIFKDNITISSQDIINCLDDHLNKRKNYSNFLWSALVMSIWLGKLN